MRDLSSSDTSNHADASPHDTVSDQPSSNSTSLNSVTHQIDPTLWLERYGDLLYNFALNRLRQHDLAEDAVQDTLVSAYRNRNTFRGESSEKTWLVAILKRKIYDCIKNKWIASRKVSLEDEANPEATLFDGDGKWRDTILSSVRPVSDCRELRDIVLNCLHRLPRVQAAIFMMRILQEKNSKEICKELDLTPSTYWSRLHRARIGLAKCVSDKWSN